MVDAREFEKLYKEHYLHFLLASFAIVKNRTDSEDIVQSFFESIWRRRETLTVHKNFRSYGISAVRKLSIKLVRKKEKDRQTYAKLVRNLASDLPETSSLVEYRFEKVNEIIQSIPESRRNIFLDFVLGSLSYQEIAEMRNISINTVKTQMRRAYDFIKSAEMDNLTILVFFLSYLF